MTEPLSDGLAFEDALVELERTVRDLEDGRLGLDEALSRYERGVGLIKEYANVESGENHADFDLLGEGGKKVPFELTKKGKAGARNR